MKIVEVALNTTTLTLYKIQSMIKCKSYSLISPHYFQTDSTISKC